MAKHLPKGKKYVLCLRTVSKDGTAHNGFKWPKKGYIEASDWDPIAECGNGLHGYLRGCGNAGSIRWDGLFQVVKVLESELVDLDGKAKFPRCEVVVTGSQKEATDLLVKEYPGLPVIGATVIVKGGGTAIVGDHGMASAGYCGKATAGNHGKASAGDCGTATAGNHGKASAGYCGKASAGDGGTASAGNGGKASAGDYGTATAGNCGAATVGYCGMASAGNDGTATAGYDGTASAGEKGRLSLLYWDSESHRPREVIGYVGEDGIEPNVAYELADGKFVKA